jgi:all-trans-8'-apo-beta-carotenal 15,15'-oxygenase
MNRRHFLSSVSVAGASVALPAMATAAATANVDAVAKKTLFTPHPALTPLRGFSGQDISCERAAIEGKLPADLRGVFYRNGPGLFERGVGAAKQRYQHWFDGDGLVNAWRFTDKGVSHQARFVQSKKFLAEQVANEFLASSFGTGMKSKMPVRNSDDVNTANTNVVKLGDKLLAMWEGGSATEMDPVTLETRGIVAWTPELKHMPFSAHPKVEADGTFWNFGTLMGKMVLYHISAAGNLIKQAVIDAPAGGMVHDFAITHKHLVFLLPPVGIDYPAMRNGLSFGESLTWKGNEPTKVMVVDKNDFSKRRILEMPAFMVFHFGNAWEADNIIHVDFVHAKNMSVMNDWMPKMMRGEIATPDESHPAFVTIDLNRGRCSINLRKENAEFPRIDPRFVGLRNRYVYYPVSTNKTDIRFGFPALMRLDTETGKTDTYAFENKVALEEHIMVPKPGSTKEGEGYLIGVGFDIEQQQTFATVFDALNLRAGPTAIVRLPYWMPMCFHGNFHAA